MQRPVGLAGQFIFVVAELDLLVVFTGNGSGACPATLMRTSVLPTVY